MTLDPASWLEAAQEIPEGSRRRTDHDCGAGRTLTVDHKENGWGAWCHRCSDKGWVSKPTPSLAQRLARLQAIRVVEDQARANPAPPEPRNYNPSTWPLPARVWLYKAGVSNERIVELGFYYCDRLARVVMPITVAGRVIFWQARGFEWSHCKYLSPEVDRTAIAPAYAPGGSSNGLPLVLTEDILSAVRVGEVTATRSLMGTAITDRVLLMVAQHRVPVAVWLDPDGPGRRAATKVARALSLHGVDTSIIRTDKDPKCYSRDEIARIINERT